MIIGGSFSFKVSRRGVEVVYLVFSILLFAHP